jgi:hypothetical protein
LARQARAHAAEIARLTKEHREKLMKAFLADSERFIAEFKRGMAVGNAGAIEEITKLKKDFNQLRKALHAAVIAKIADRLLLVHGPTVSPTEQDVAAHALGKETKPKRIMLPIMREGEVNFLIKMVHHDGAMPVR